MNFKKKLLIGTVLLAVVSIVLFNIKGLLFNSYRETNDYLDYKLPEFIKKDSINKFVFDKSFKNNFGSILTFYRYKQDRELMIWKINEYSSIELSSIKTISKPYKTNRYLSIENKMVDQKYPYMAAIVNPRLDSAYSISIFANKVREDTVIITSTYIYSCLNFSEMGFFRNKKEDFYIAKYPGSPRCISLIYKFNGTFYLIYYYSLNKLQVRKDELLNILELNVENGIR